MMELTSPCQQVVHVLPLLSGGPKQYLWEWGLTSVVTRRKETFFTPSGSLHLSICIFFQDKFPVISQESVLIPMDLLPP